MDGLKHIGLFEGIGGFSLAAQWAGWETVAWCEWNEFGQKVLRHHFPKAEGFGDITKTDFTKYANKIDIVTGGFPCQPYSSAGKRKGKEDERHLWPEMLRAIREIQPSYVVGENVRGLTNWNGGLVFDEVQADLEAEGYEVLPFLLPACGTGALHQRDRIWFIAYNKSNGNSEWKKPFSRTEASIGINKFLKPIEQPTSTTEQYIKSSVCTGVHGLSEKLDGIAFSKWKKETIKAAGNAIYPPVAFEIFKVINAIRSLK
jgi:DNA (cytosine-5)-methyltransferase 1